MGNGKLEFKEGEGNLFQFELAAPSVVTIKSPSRENVFVDTNGLVGVRESKFKSEEVFKIKFLSKNSVGLKSSKGFLGGYPNGWFVGNRPSVKQWEIFELIVQEW